MRAHVLVFLLAAACGPQAEICTPGQAQAQGRAMALRGERLDYTLGGRCDSSDHKGLEAGYEAGRREACNPEAAYREGVQAGFAGAAPRPVSMRFAICDPKLIAQQFQTGYIQGARQLCDGATQRAYDNGKAKGIAGQQAILEPIPPSCGPEIAASAQAELKRGFDDGIKQLCTSVQLSLQAQGDGEAGRPPLDIKTNYALCDGKSRARIQREYDAGYQLGAAKFCTSGAIETQGRSDGEAGKPRATVGKQVATVCGAKKMQKQYDTAYESGLARFCASGSAQAQGFADGEAGRAPANLKTQFGACDATAFKRLQAQYQTAFKDGVAKLCNTAAIEAQATADGQAGRVAVTLDAKYATCGKLQDTYDAAYENALAGYCALPRVTAAAQQSAAAGALNAAIPAGLTVCVDRFPRVRKEYEAAFAQARDQYTANSCTFEAGVAAGTNDATASNDRNLGMPAFCDRNRFQQFQAGYLDGWKQTKARLCSEVEASQKGVADAQAGQPLSYTPPANCPPELHSGLLAAYRAGFASVPPRTTYQPPASNASQLTWSDTAKAFRAQTGSRYSFSCPPTNYPQNVWGTDYYSDDSSICSAAVHAGVITLGGGTFTIEIRQGASSFSGSSRNGVRSSNYGSWPGSFVFVAGSNFDDDDTANDAQLYTRCVDWADERYRRSLGSSEARDRANARCRDVRDLEIADFVFNVAAKSVSYADAADLALEAASRRLKRKLDLLRFIEGEYERSLSYVDAVKRAINGVDLVSRKAKSCIESNYDAYVRTLSYASAMDKAISQCAQQFPARQR